MKKLRFKSRNGVLYFGVGDKLKSSKLKDTKVNRNILSAKFRDGELDEELFGIENHVKTTINDLLYEVLKSKSISLKHKSILAYTSVLNNNIIPFFDGRYVATIKPFDIRKWHDFMIAKGLKRSAMTHARVLMKEAFELAMLKEIVDTNPIKIVSMPRLKSTKKVKKPFTLDEIDLILEHAHGELKNFLGISFFTGIRSGELLALKWEDVDFVTDTISINKTIASGIINSPKTASSYRDIEMIDKAKEFFQSQRFLTGLKNSYVFLNKKGLYYNRSSVIYAHYIKLLNELGIERRSLHNTRHTFASMMLNHGIEPIWVSNMLGHDNLDITLKVYAHFMPKKEKMSLKFLEKRYKNGTKNV